MFLSGARAGILDGLFITDADIEAPKWEGATELASGLRDTLAPKFDTGVFDRLGGGGPCIVPARLRGADWEDIDGFLVSMPLFEGVFARGGATFWEEAYSSSR
jgi:hypothetical protein